MKAFHGGFNQTNLMLHILMHLFISLAKVKKTIVVKLSLSKLKYNVKI
jgi:hypothetical protein